MKRPAAVDGAKAIRLFEGEDHEILTVDGTNHSSDTLKRLEQFREMKNNDYKDQPEDD